MNVAEFMKKNPDVPDDYKYLCQSLLLSGANAEKVLAEVTLRMDSDQKNKEIKASRGVDLSCPNCKSVMSRVKLIEGREAVYCPNDRVTLPLPR